MLSLDDLVQPWHANNVITLALLERCPDGTLEFKPGKGKTIRSNFVHIIYCRVARIEEKFSKLRGVFPKLDWKSATREELRTGLLDTEQPLLDVLSKRIEKPDRFGAMAFLAYMVAHEAHHRSQIELALRLNGAELDDDVMYGLWEAWTKAD